VPKVGARWDLIWVLPLVLAAVYLVIFVVKIPHNLRDLGWVSDYASAFTVPETLAQTGTGGHTVLASSGQWLPLWFGILTAKLPLHHQLWAIAPTALFVFSTLIVGWSVAQVADHRTALLTVLIMLVASPAAFNTFMAGLDHNALYPCTALTGAYLIWLTRGAGRSRIISFAVPLLAGVALGVCIASDLLVVATSAAPLFLAGVLAGLRRNSVSRLVALSALATAAIAVPVAKITSATMHAAGYVTLQTPFEVVHLSALATQGRLLFRGLEALFNGNLGHIAPGGLSPVLEVACNTVMVIALLTLLVVGVLATARFIWAARRKGGSASTAQLALVLHIFFWVGSSVAVCVVAIVGADMSAATSHEAYYATVIFAVAAVVPLLASRGRLARSLIAAGMSIFFIGSLVGLMSNYPLFTPAVKHYESTIRSLAKRYDATTGYAGYWYGSSFTWSTDNQIVVRPVMECRSSTSAYLCPFYLERVPSWYVPHRRRTFLLVGTEESWLSQLPRGLGRPIAAYRFGSISMYIYPYDIASRLGPPLT
jgi:hypothetical protein